MIMRFMRSPLGVDRSDCYYEPTLSQPGDLVKIGRQQLAGTKIGTNKWR
jgi:hypothetical protein